VVGCCEHGNEPSGSINDEEFLDSRTYYLASQEGLCSMQLVSYLISFFPLKMEIGGMELPTAFAQARRQQ
jgi:hypothetical protein